MPVKKIFDATVFNDFKAVSYVSSPKFFIDTVKDFQNVVFILGIDNVDNLNKFSDGISAYFENAERIKFFNDLPDETKDLICKNKFQIRYGKQGVMIHEKIYLLSNDETKNYRVIIGSANFSFSAFNSENYNFENVRIDDSEILYRLYLNRFDYLLKQTNDYVPEMCRRKYADKKILLTVSPDSEFDILIDDILSQRISLAISTEQIDSFHKFQEQISQESNDIEKKKLIIENIFEKTSADGNFKLPKVDDFLKKKNIFIDSFKKSNFKTNADDFRETLLMTSDYKIYKNFDSQSEDMEFYSKSVDEEKIRAALEKINMFTNGYLEFATSPNKIIPSKIFEIILYAFTTPFI